MTSSTSSNSILSDAELEAAIAEIEALAPGETGNIPSLDDGSPEDGSSEKVHYVAVKPAQSTAAHALSRTASSTQSIAVVSAPADDSADRPRKMKTTWLRALLRHLGWAWMKKLLSALPFVRSERSAVPDSKRTPAVAPAATEADPERPAEQDGPVAEAPPWRQRIYEALDALLELVNRPFAPQTRRLIGLVAAVTLATSALAFVLFPLFYPNRDALGFLEQKRAELLMSELADETDETAEGES